MLRKFGVAFLVAAVAGAGLYLGMAARQAVPDKDAVIRPPSSGLKDSTLFPDVALLGDDGRLHQTAELLGPRGSVVIFMALGCAPCKSMAHEWEQHRAAGRLGELPLFGITDSRIDLIKLYKGNNGITFPIYSDTSLVFTREYGVDEYPLRLLIDGGHVIRAHTYDPSEDADVAAALKTIGQ